MKYLLLAGALLCVVANANADGEIQEKYCPSCHQFSAVGCWVTSVYDLCPEGSRCAHIINQQTGKVWHDYRGCMSTSECVTLGAMGGEVCKDGACVNCDESAPEDVDDPGVMNTAPSYGVCFTRSDPHFKGYDAPHTKKLSFPCWTNMVTDGCGGGTNTFSVSILALPNGFEDHTVVKEAKVNFGQVVAELGNETSIVLDGQKISLEDYGLDNPIDLGIGEAVLMAEGKAMKLKMDNGIDVLWDFNGQLTVRTPNDYPEPLCGLCGNFNGDADDDQMFGDVSSITDQNCPKLANAFANAEAVSGQATDDTDLFVKSWFVGLEGEKSSSCAAECNS